MSGIFLWPEAQPLALRHLLGSRLCTADVEAQLRQLYPSAEPVLFSSARAGLSCLLEHLALSRPTLVWCPPYSSHCVFDAIARIATPTTEAATPAVALVYHQWGFVNTPTFPTETIIIEDAVDTLFLPGASPFAIDGRFALWSLPKVIASQWGGVVFCRHAADADVLRQRRNARSLPTTLQASLRALGKRSPTMSSYWHGNEANGGNLPGFALRQIAEHLEKLPQEAALRQQRLQALQTHSLMPWTLADRLPSNLPFADAPSLAAPFRSGQSLSAGTRQFNRTLRIPETRWESVRPIPIHQDISGTDIAEIKARVTLADDSSLNEPNIL